MSPYPQTAAAGTLPARAQRDQLLLTVDQAAELMHMGRDYVYGEINAGRLRSLKLGRSRRIPRSEVDRHIATLLAEQCPAAGPAA